MLCRVGDTHIDHDGKRYAPGDIIDVTEEQAAVLRVTPLSEAEQKTTAMTKDQIIEELKTRNIEIPKNPTKAVLVELLEKAQATQTRAE